MYQQQISNYKCGIAVG